jgi:riboflavin kinase/FMN adenylyltransferase
MELAGDVVSSTAIRRALGQGDVESATRLLGRPFLLVGHVAPGQGRGRILGFPTANLEVDPALVVPGDGIYATWAHVDGARHLSATSIGVRPTFGGGQRTVETYVMDFSAELYGKELSLEFVRRLRDEQRFESEEGLVAQMHRDVAQARVALGRVGPEQAGGLQPQSLQR